MTKIEITDKIVLVEVPEGAREPHIEYDTVIMFRVKKMGYWMREGYDLFDKYPNLTYSWAKKPGEISEMEAAGCVERVHGIMYKDYMDSGMIHTWCTAAHESLLSLIRSKGFNPNNCIVVKINEKNGE